MAGRAVAGGIGLSAIFKIYQRFCGFIGDFFILSAIPVIYQRFYTFISDSVVIEVMLLCSQFQ